MKKLKYSIGIINLLLSVLLLTLIFSGKSEGFLVILPAILLFDTFLLFKKKNSKALTYITIGWAIMYVPIAISLITNPRGYTGGGYELYYVVGIPLIINFVLHALAYWKLVRVRS